MHTFVKSWATTLAGLLLACTAWSQAPQRSYAVISEVGRQLTLVGAVPAIGTRLDANVREQIPAPGGTLDKVFLFTTEAALNKVQPGAPVWLLAPVDSDFFPRTVFSDGSTVKLPEDLAAALKERGSTHLVLFSPHRSEASHRFRDGTIGVGRLEGLGYYVDNDTVVRVEGASDSAPGKSAPGYLATYAHVRAALIDVASSRVVRVLTTQAHTITPVAGTPSNVIHPWNALTSAQKLEELRLLIVKEVDRLVPQLVAATP